MSFYLFLARLSSNFPFFCAVTSIIAVGDLELPFGDEEDEHESLAEQPAVEATPFARRNKRKEAAPALDNAVQPETSGKNSRI